MGEALGQRQVTVAKGPRLQGTCPGFRAPLSGALPGLAAH